MLVVAGIQLMDCNVLDIMALQIERYSFSKATGFPHISIPPSWRFVWRVSPGTHEVSAAVHNGSIGLWIMVSFPSLPRVSGDSSKGANTQNVDRLTSPHSVNSHLK